MGLPQKVPKTSALLVAAIKKLKSIHGSTSREITNYVASECDDSMKNIKRQMKLALRRGISAGVLNRSKDGYYTCALVDDSELPAGDRSRRGGCGRKRRSRRRRCGKSRRRKRRSGRRRSSRRRRRGGKCGKKRRGRSRRGRSRRRRRGKCGRRRHEEGAEVDELADSKMARKPRAKRANKNVRKKKNDSKSSSQMRIGSASSTETQRSGGADTASVDLSASGKESLSDQSDVSGNSDVNSGETKP